MVNLTKGAIYNIMKDRECDKPVFQVLSYKPIPGSGGASERFRLQVSDGECYHTFAMLATQLNDLIYKGQLGNYAVIKVDRYICNVVKASNDNKRIIILLEITILATGSEIGQKIGNPVLYSEEYARNLPSVQPKPVSNTPQSSYYGSSTASSAPKETVPNHAGSMMSNVQTHPISSLTPYQNKWTIRARVTNKTPIKHWSNAKGEGKLFSMDLLDESGEIRCTAFNQQVDKFFNDIEINKIYYVSRCILKTANKRFTSIKNDYEMSCSNDTQIVPCYDDSTVIPTQTFDFMEIEDIEKVAANSLVDIIGICKSFQDVQTIVARQTNRELKKREIELVNARNVAINFTLWGEQAEQFQGEGNPVIAVKSARVSDFSGRSLSAITSSVIQINPDMKEAHILRGWFDQEGMSKPARSLTQRSGGAAGGPAASATFAEAKIQQLGSDKADYFSNTATVVMFRKENAMYQACPADNCNKKVIDLSTGLYRCEKCSKEYPNFNWRLLLSMNLADVTDNCWVTCFQESGEAILGESSQTIGEAKDRDEERYQQIFNQATFQTFDLKFRVKSEFYNGENRLKTTIVSASPLDYREHNQKLLAEIKELVSQG